jgi:hypothetical protein
MNANELKQMELREDDNNRAFACDFTENGVFKELLAQRYSLGQCNWMKRCDNGKMLVGDKLNKYARKTRQDSNQILLIYREKIRKRDLFFLKDGSIIINNSIRTDIEHVQTRGMQLVVLAEENKELSVDICISDTVKHFIENYKALSAYERGRARNPIRQKEFKQQEIFLKAMVLLVLKNKGMTAKQVFRLTDIANDLDITSRMTLELIKSASTLKKEELQKAFSDLVLQMEAEVKQYFAYDAAYLILAGEYDLQTKYKLQTEVFAMLELENKADIIFYQIEKEYFNYE